MRAQSLVTRAAALCCVWLLSGCAASGGGKYAQEARQQLVSVPVCCASLSDAKRQELPKSRTELKLDNQSQAFVFGDGKSFFQVFTLPAFVEPYEITLSSTPVGTVLDQALMAPRIGLYDADFKETRAYDEKGLRKRGSTFERTIFINASNARERFLVLHASPIELVQESRVGVTNTMPIFAGPVIFHYTSGSEATMRLHNAPTGSYVIEPKGLPSK